MKLAKLLRSFVIVCAFSNLLSAQTPIDLGNGFKPYGSYDSGNLDSVDLQNGNLILHAPIIPDYPQRGGKLQSQLRLYLSSHNWLINCSTNSHGLPYGCVWKGGGTGVGIEYVGWLSVQRTITTTVDPNFGSQYEVGGGYALTTWDGAKHQLYDASGGALSSFVTMDATGYRVAVSNPDQRGIPQTVVVTDRQGTQHVGTFGPGRCSDPAPAAPRPAGGYARVYDQWTISPSICVEHSIWQYDVDTNGNVRSLALPLMSSTPPLDTMGRPSWGLQGSVVSDSVGCDGSIPFANSYSMQYVALGGVQNPLKICYGALPIQTAFGITGIAEYQVAVPGATFNVITTVILPNGTKWVFHYDSYGNVTSISLPTGGSITYSWVTVRPDIAPQCALNDPWHATPAIRAIKQRIVADNNGHTSTWTYQWGVVQADSSVTNWVTDPAGNDTVHAFKMFPGSQCVTTSTLHETTTQFWQGAKDSGKLLKQIDTSYGRSVFMGTADSFVYEGNAVPTEIKTTVYPANKVSLVHRDYDSAFGTSGPMLGNVVSEKIYDWGVGSPGPLLRETDTVYQWQKNSAYLSANLIDLPASVVVISPTAASNTKSSCPVNPTTNAACMSELDYSYDENSPQAHLGTPPTGTLVAPPSPVRGNLTTASKWLSTSNNFISSTNVWFDTGMLAQTTDPLGHITSYTYDPSETYVVKTCNPKNQCVYGSYDFNTGSLMTFTDVNGSSAGDAAHTTNYNYETLTGRIASALAPPDPANSSVRAQTSFAYSDVTSPNVFPFTVTRNQPITTALTDSSTTTFDGLGRPYKAQHVLPGGTSTVDTTFDVAHSQVIVTNPYFSTSDPTYGSTTTLSDPLGRATQVTRQDGSVSKVAYSVQTTIAVNGDCTQTTDEAGNQRGACSDALGRLVEVDEPNSANPVQVNYLPTLLTDGNFVLENAAGTGIWSTGTYGTNASSIYIQDDGNLVLYVFKWQAGTYATPSPGPFPAASCSIGSYLMVNQRLNANQCLASPHGQYLLYMAPDGNFYIYDLAHNTGTWGPGTYGHPGAYAIMQGDGNFCIYDANNVYLWCSGTSGTNADRLNMEDDGRVIIYKSAWNSGTGGQAYGTAMAHPGCDVGNSGLGQTGVLGSGSCLVSPNGRFELLMQADGNLVIYDRSVTPNKGLWYSGTAISQADPGFAMRTLYSYDALGNLLRVDQKGTAPNDSTQWRTRTFTYDSLSRLTQAINPESGTITYSYDADGNLLQKTSPAPNQTGTATQTVSYCYDELHRVTGKGYGAQTCPLTTPVVTYTYDSGTNAIGHLTSLTDQAGTATYTFDILGRLTTETRPIAGISKSTSYTYNLDGSVKTLTYPSGRVVTYTPGAGGVLTSATDGNGTQYVSNAAYYANGTENTRSMPGIFFSTTLNSRLQVSAFYSNNGTDAGIFVNKGYDYGSGHNNGNVMSIANYKDSNRTQTFTYDALNRISSAWSSANTGNYSWGENYSIDAWGNLQISPMGGKAHGGTFALSGNAQNRPTGLSYDAAGNLLSYLSSTYNYDQENRLLSTAGMSYTYDGNGERVLKSNTSTGAAVKRYWSMGGNTLAEGDGAGNLTAEYIYFGGKRIARIDLPANTVHYYLSDHLGSTSVVVSAAGAVEEESDYYPFGTEVVVTGPGTNELKFTGKRRDTESQLDYFSARYFESPIGRFMSSDPLPWLQWQHGEKEEQEKFNSWILNPQNLNTYSYVDNNPLNHTDPTGMNACGTNNDSNCKVTVTISDRSKDAKGHYNDQFTSVAHQGEYNATATVNVNGKDVGTFLVKTTPDDSSKSATLKAGVYTGSFVMHKGKYPAIAIGGVHAGVPTVGPNPSRKDGASIAFDIHIHHAGLGNAGFARNGPPISEGCQVVCTSQYSAFQRATGIVPVAGTPQNTFTIDVRTSANQP